MARPDFGLDTSTGIFTFDNGHVTIAAQTNVISPPPLPDTITVQSVTLTNPAVDTHNIHILGVADVAVPDHVFDLLG